MKCIDFSEPKEMLTLLRSGVDLYNIQTNEYVSEYDSRGSLAVYVISKEFAVSLEEKVRNSDETYWGAFLGPGGSIYDAEIKDQADRISNTDYCAMVYSRPGWIHSADVIE